MPPDHSSTVKMLTSSRMNTLTGPSMAQEGDDEAAGHAPATAADDGGGAIPASEANGSSVTQAGVADGGPGPGPHDDDEGSSPSPPPPPPMSPSAELRANVDRLFRDTVCLAPMVRAGTLPLRLLSLRHGADVVWGEEIIDRKMMGCERRVNARLGTVDFVTPKDGKLVFQTTDEERGKVIFQLGATPRNPQWAVQAAQLVAGDVAAVDVNMGCPKKFSVQDGMGAALLENEEGAASILRALRAALPPHLPVTCKIRLLETPEKTLRFARAMATAGASAIGVHMRTKQDKPTDPARWSELKALVDGLDIPVIANGDLYTRAAVVELRALSGCRSVMLARPALYNPSVFRTLKEEEGQQQLQLRPLDEVMAEYLRLCVRYGNHVNNSKYTLMEMMVKRRHPDHLKATLPIDLPPGKTVALVSRCKRTEDLAALWGLDLADAETTTAAQHEREGLHVCSDDYFAGEGAAAAGVSGKREREEEVQEQRHGQGQHDAAKRPRGEAREGTQPEGQPTTVN